MCGAEFSEVQLKGRVKTDSIYICGLRAWIVLGERLRLFCENGIPVPCKPEMAYIIRLNRKLCLIIMGKFLGLV